MFGIGFGELIIVGLILLVFVGPEDLPKVASQIARFINQLKNQSDDFIDDLKKTSDWEQLQNQSRRLKSELEKPVTIDAPPNPSSTSISPSMPTPTAPSPVTENLKEELNEKK